MKRFFMFLGTSGDLILLIAILLFLAFSAFASPVKAENINEGIIESSYFSKEELKNIRFEAYITGCYVYREIALASKAIYNTDELVIPRDNGIFLPYVYRYKFYDSVISFNLDYRNNKIIYISYTANCVVMINSRSD